MVPTPTVPPRSHPAASTVTSIAVRTTRIEWPRAAKPVITPSRGPGPRPGADVRTGRDAVQDDAAEHRGSAQREVVRRRDGRQGQVDDEPDHDDVAERSEPRALPKREPEREDAGADDDRPRSDAEPELPRQPLVKDVPRVDAEAAEEEQSVAEAVQGEPEVELAQSPETWRRQHQTSLAVNGLAPVGPIWYQWPGWQV